MKGLTDMLVSFFKERKVLAGTLVGLFIPAIYCFLYLNAIWDPYGKVDRVPGIILNYDKEAELDGDKLQLGKDLTEQMLKDKKLNWTESTDEAAAMEELKQGKVYVVMKIPETFSADVAALVKDSDKAPAPIQYYVNQGESLIVSQIGDRMTEVLKEQLNDKVSEKVLTKLVAAVSDGQEGFLKAADGAGKLQDGAAKLAEGSGKLTDSLQQARQGSEKLAQGAAKALEGTGKLSGGLGQIKRGNEQAAAQMAQGAQAVGQIGQKLQQLSQAPGLPDATKMALAQLAAQMQQLGAAFDQGSKSMSAMVAGEEQAVQQSQQLVEGVRQLQQGLTALSDGLGKGADGSKEISENLVKLQNSMKEIKDKLAEAGNTPVKLKGKENLLNTPISIEKTYVHPVPNNGTFFTGFFAPLSLWVGAIVFSYLTIMVKWRGWARRSLLPRYALLAVLGVAQALILDLLLIKGLGLRVDNMADFVWMTILTSLTFISIIHFIFAMTGVAGNLIVLILLVFQLGLSGGSYPVAMLSDINRHLSNWLPLTYAVHGFRIAISGGTAELLREQVVHILYFLAIGLGLHVLYGVGSRVKSLLKKNRHKTNASQEIVV
jgi:putative membrane protein